MDYIQQSFSERIGGTGFGLGTNLYKFEKIKQAKRRAAAAHPDMALIDLGVGEPESMADQGIVEELYRSAQKWENRGYADNGITEFKYAAADYMKNVYGVPDLQPDKEMLPVMGSKSALAMLPQAFVNPGDVTLITVPGYPVMGTITEWLGGKAYPLPLKKENGCLPVLSGIPNDILHRAKLIYVNYPNNPTGQSATPEFYEDLIRFARDNEIIVVQDAAYAALTFGGRKPLSFLSLPGAKDVGVEIHSLSKAFQMTGWRLGFVCGNDKVVQALAAVKDNYDSGQFKAIQHAGIYAFRHPEITRAACDRYERRHRKLASVLRDIGFNANIPEASFYQYVHIPKGAADGSMFDTAEAFSEYLIENALISTVPWDDAGPYIRLSVTFVADNIEEECRVLNEIKSRLSRLNLIF